MRRKWQPMKDLSTPEERKLLDRLERVRPDMAPLKITWRDPSNGCLHFTRDRQFRGGRGAYLINWSWIKKEIARCRRRDRRERQKDIQNHIGAYI